MKLEPIENKNLQSGLITEGAVAESRIPLDAVTESLNFHFDRIGAATLRKGTTQLGNSLSGNILGLYEFRDSGSGTNNQIIVVNGTIVYYLSGSTWTPKRTGLTSGSKARFTTFLDYVFMVNGTESTAIWDGATGNTFVTTGNASGAPTGQFIENYRSRVWIAGNSTYPDRVYFSSLPSAVTTPVITWDTDVSTGDWIDISPSDGENITALKRSRFALLVFKQNHIYRIFNKDESDPDPKINVGTYSAESIVEAKNGAIYFHHPTGFYKIDGNDAQEISRPIIDIIKNITLTNYSKIAGWVEADGDHVCWSVGDVTIGDITYSKLVVRYTISSQIWTHYSFPYQMLVSSKYNDGSTLYQLVGNTNGEVLKVDTGTDDNGTPIVYSLTHRWATLDGLMSTRKTVNKMLFHHDGGQGSEITYQKENQLPNTWSNIGQFDKPNTYFNNANIQAVKFRPRITGSSTGQPFTYYGFEVLDADSQLINI